MSLAYDLLVATVVTTFAGVVHYLAVELFAPESALFAIATDGTAVFNGQQNAEFWFVVLAVWVPIIVVVGIWTYVFVRMYKRQVATGVGAARPP